ncbi:hypothetical protein HCH52_02780 [Oscillospiraceae bacterium HV4-5-C5C]|nr:hypothetical protein [Oscillospiraceae bacterium HV4-5-C5C]
MKNNSDKAKPDSLEQQPAELVDAAKLYEPVFWSEEAEEDPAADQVREANASVTSSEAADIATDPTAAVADSADDPQSKAVSDQTQIRNIRPPAGIRPVSSGEVVTTGEPVPSPDRPPAQPVSADSYRSEPRRAEVRPGQNRAGVAPSQTQSVSLTGWRQNASTFLKQNLLRRKPNGRKTVYKPLKYRGIGSRLRRQGPNKIYRLKGYTTVTRVNRKRRRERLKRHTHNLISFAVIILALILLFIWLNPLPKLQDLLHALGFSQ